MKKIIILFFLSCFSATGAFAAEKMEVFVSIPPLKWLAEKVGGENAKVHVLVGQGQDPHSFEPTPKQMAALSRAKIWFVINMDFEQQLIKKIRGLNKELMIIDIAHDVVKLEMSGDHHHGQDEHEEVHQKDEHHEDEHHEGEHKDDHADAHKDEHGDEHGDQDPHVWLSPLNLEQMALAVKNGLTKRDNENKSKYTKRYLELKKELNALNQQISEQLSPYKGSVFYVFHPSFGYFADAYGLTQKAVEVEGKAPTPKQLSKLIATAKAEKVKIIFAQPQFDKKSAAAVAAAIGGTVVTLDAMAVDVPGNLKTMAEKVQSALSR